MINKNQMQAAVLSGRVLLGLVMLIPGIVKLSNPAGIIGMLGGLGFPAPTLFGWLLIIAEIGFGLAIIANYKLEYTVLGPMVILLVATVLVAIPGALRADTFLNTGWNNVFIHLALIANYWVFGAHAAH